MRFVERQVVCCLLLTFYPLLFLPCDLPLLAHQ